MHSIATQCIHFSFPLSKTLASGSKADREEMRERREREMGGGVGGWKGRERERERSSVMWKGEAEERRGREHV